MLNNYCFSFFFFRFVQNGFYIDFFIKKIIEILCKNLFIYTAQFFGEKYLIEYFTKKVIESYIFNLNSKYNFFIFYYSYFFTYNLSVFFLCFSIINIFLLLY